METEANETGIGNSLPFYLNVGGRIFVFIPCRSCAQTTVSILYHNLHLYINAYVIYESTRKKSGVMTILK